MAEDLRADDPAEGIGHMKDQLIAECAREEENALWTSTTFYIWLRFLKTVRAALWVAAAICSSLAASHILRGDPDMKFIMALAALAAVIFPAIGRALRLDAAIHAYEEAAGKLKNLQGEFRRARLVWLNKPADEFEKEARKLFKGMNEVRKPSLTPPEWCFRLASRKIKAGHYEHDTDAPRGA
jgi:hypothetical protein